MFSAGVRDRLQNPLEFILLAFRTIKLARAASQRRKKRAVGRTEGVKRGRVDIWKWSSFETPVAHQTLSLYLLPLFLSVSYCGFGSLSLRGGAFTSPFEKWKLGPSHHALQWIFSLFSFLFLFSADWLEGCMLFVTHSRLSVCYIFANKYTYKWVFKGAWPWPNHFVSLYTDCTSCSDFRNKLDSYVHYLSMDVSEPAWFNWG